MTRTNNASK